MAHVKEMIGKRFGKVTVIERAGSSGMATWVYLCDCGNHGVTTGANMRQGRTKSCGDPKHRSE